MSAAALPVEATDLAGRLDALHRAGGSALVAIEWGPPTGLVVLGRCSTLTALRPVGLITTLVVEPDSRRRGIGRVLLKAAARAARQAGCDRLLLHVAPGQADLRAFCAAAGFADEGQVLGRPLLKRGSAGT